MALQVWLPLNGNLNNQGVSSQNAMQTSPNSSFDDGKLGKCLHIKGSVGNQNYYPGLAGVTKFTICCWMKINDADKTLYTGYQDFFSVGCNADGATSNNAGIRIEHKGEGATTMQSELWRNGTTMSGKTYISTISCDISDWTHIAIAFDGNNAYTYKNGVLSNTLAKSSIYTTQYSLTGYVTLGMAGTYVLLNDFRIYDECLSKEEIREISKGLVLHYPLDNPYNTSLTNLLSDEISEGYFPSIQSGTTRTKIDGYYNYKINRTRADNTSEQTYNQLTGANASSWTAGNQYFFYCKFRLNSYQNIRKFSFRPSRVSNDWSTSTVNLISTELGKWIEVYKVITVPATFDRDGTTVTSTGPKIEFWIYDTLIANAVVKADYDIKDMMIVESSISVPFVRNSFKDTTVYDCSGFGNNGETRGTIGIKTDSPRYSSSITITAGGICGPLNNPIKPNVMTISGWAKMTSTVPSGEALVLCCYESGGAGISVQTNNVPRMQVYLGGAYDGANATSSPLALNQWYHLCGTYDGSTIKIYVNGELITSKSNSGALTYQSTTPWAVGYNPNSSGGGTATFPGQLSDVRLYSTVLSADDIKLLYNRGASIDNLGNLHCGEIVEDDASVKQQVKKNTQVKCKNAIEANSLPIYANNSISTTKDPNTVHSFTPTADTNDSCSYYGSIYIQEAGDYTLEINVSYSGFDSTSTAGTFSLNWQGANHKIADNSWVWEGSNYATTALNAQKTLTSLVKGTGSYSYKVNFNVSSSWLATYNASVIGFRSNYSNGIGNIKITSVKLSKAIYNQGKTRFFKPADINSTSFYEE